MAISSSIKSLIAGNSVADSQISRRMLDELLANGLLIVITHGSRKSYQARDIEALKRFLIDKDETYRMIEVKDPESRASMAAETGNSKLVMVRSCPGFPVNSYDPIECLLNGDPFVVTPQEGSFLFVSNWKSFVVPEDVIVVGIENMENFRNIRQQRNLFETVLGMHRFIFVSRYPQSTDLRLWLQGIPNNYVHFGDFDFAGIQIYSSEIQKYLGERSSFFIPHDIEYRLKNGSRERYDSQYKYSSINSSDTSLQSLIDLINKYHRCYDQEGYISKPL